LNSAGFRVLTFDRHGTLIDSEAGVLFGSTARGLFCLGGWLGGP